MTADEKCQLAINGGEKIRSGPMPERFLFLEEEKAAVTALFDRCIHSGAAFAYGGEEEEAYCREFAEFFGGGYADAVNSGTSAIYVALRALNLEPFTEVIVPPVTDMGGVMPVPLLNCIPIPADTAPGIYNVGPEQIEERITERTSAIVAAHIAGHPVDMDPVMEIARSKGIPVVEDCAQAHGATYKGRLVGTIGDIAAFSTMSGKHHATGGQGGLVYTKNEELYWRARQISDRGKPFGLEGVTTNVICSHNLNLNDLSAAIGRIQLKKLPRIVEGCRRVASQVAKRCRDLKAVQVDGGIPEGESSYWFLPFRLDIEKVRVSVDTFVEALCAEGIHFTAHYVKPFTEHEWYKDRTVFGSSGFPWTCPLYKGDPNQEYPLPNFEEGDKSLFFTKVHENMTEKEAEDIAAALRKVEKAFLD